MKDLTKKEFSDYINNLNLDKKNKENILNKFSCFELAKEQTSEPTLENSRYLKDSLVFFAFETLKNDFIPLLKYDYWRESYIETINQIFQYNHYSGSSKNLFLSNFYQIYQKSEFFGFSNKESCNRFIHFFTKATNLICKNEEQSIVCILNDLFSKIDKIDKDFFKELFAIYLENIKTDPKYQIKINKIKKWGETQDFNFLGEKYKNIRNFFDSSQEETVFTASVKKFNLVEMSKKNKTKINGLEHAFNTLNQFISKKLIGNSNIQNFIVQDEKIFHKIIVVYEKRDSFVEATLKIHDLFFEYLRQNTKVELNFAIEELWSKITLHAELNNKLTNKEENKKFRKI